MAKKNKLTDEDIDLLAELGIEAESKAIKTHSAREERIIAGFEEIQAFVKDNGRLPEHGEDKDIFERLYAVRLDQIRKQQDARSLLEGFDYQNLLSEDILSDTSGNISDEELLEQLGVNADREDSITNLKHVQSRAERKAAEEVANRTICLDFEKFKPLFDNVVKEIEEKSRKTVQFRKDAGFTKTSLKEGQFIIVGGQISYIAEIGETIKAPNGDDDARLRVIYINGTESNILLRSLIRAMYKDETSRFITDSSIGPLFSEDYDLDDIASGTIYVLRSLSDHPTITDNRNIVHKIGVTGGEVKQRLGNTKYDPTFLMADVEVVATYKLANINRTRLEKIFHKFLSPAKLQIQVKDRFGKHVNAQEWFLVPLFIIDEMVERIKDGSIQSYYYDPVEVKLTRI